MIALKPFAEALVAIGRGEPAGHASEMAFDADLDESWRSLRGVHGGFVCALVTSAVAGLEPDRHVRTIHASFLRPTAPGPIEIGVSRLRRGRTLSTYRATVRQSGRDALDLRVTMCDETASPAWSSPLLPRPPAITDCVAFEPPFSVPHFAHSEIRLDPDHLPGDDAGAALVCGYIRPVPTTAIDALWLIMAGDAFPPAPFRRLAPPQGGVSIDYTVHVHAPERFGDEWIEGSFLAAESHAGLAVEHGALRGFDGALIAETFHTRWTA